MNSAVFALTYYNGQIVAVGLFTEAGGFPASGVAAWDDAVSVPDNQASRLTLTPFAYPNPTPGPCRISFGIPAEGPASVEVVGIDGRQVRHLFDGPRGAGTFSLNWDGRDDAGQKLPAGVYLTRVQTAGSVSTGRVVLVR
jgi:hypothetical protein